jgi:catalase
MGRFRSALPVAVALAFAGSPLAPAAYAEDAPVEEQIADAFQAIFGQHPGQRLNHAKGIVVEGAFMASPDAATLSRAAHLRGGGTIPVTVRFSDSTGVPNIPDGDPNANPHGMSVKFHLPDGSDTDIVINSLKFFPVATAVEFRDLLLAIAATKPDSPKPTKLDDFLASHPAAPKALATPQTPSSFATDEYYGVNAFQFVDKEGKKQPFRYQAEPMVGVSHLAKDEAAKRPPDYLGDELRERLKNGPVQFRLLAQLAESGDPTKDATVPWPDSRRKIELGVLTLTTPAPDNEEAQKQLLFLPGQVTDGIEASDDPLIPLRDGVYAISFSRRSE